MPIYEYVCDGCGHALEAFQKLSEDPLKTCPACSEDALRKKVSAAAFRLKGGGWYETDFKSGGKRNVIDGDKEATKTSENAGEKASDGAKQGDGGEKGAASSSSETSAASKGSTAGSGSAGD